MYVKNAQIGIFIIVSVIIIFVGVAFVSFNSDFELFADQTSSYQVSEYVEACMNQQLEKGISIMGRQGGWIYPPNSIYYTEEGDVDTLIREAEGIHELGTNKIPYWYYYDEKDDAFKTNHIPPYDSEDEDSLRMQLKRYMDNTLESECLQGFSTFEDAYDIYYEEESINHNVEFENDQIRAELNLPIEIREIATNTTKYVEDFSQTKNNKLKVPYHLAKDIANAQDKTSFMETRMMQMLRPYMSKNSRELLPPTYDFSTNFNPEPWLVPDVVKRMKQIFSTNIGKVQLKETNVDQTQQLPQQLQDSELAQGITGMYTKYYLGNPEQGIDHSFVREDKPNIFEQYKEMNVEPHHYPFYPLSVSLSPSLGDIIVMPESQFFTSLVPFSTTTYQTSYEFHGPVVFSLQDSRQSPNDNFEFRVAYEMNVEHNKPLKENYPEPALQENSSLQTTPSQSLVCARPQFVSKPVKINITDPLSNPEEGRTPEKGVEDALVEFSCKGGIATCTMGTTQLDENERTELEISLPLNCEPGTLTISKMGHRSVEFDNLNPNSNEPINLGEVSMPSTKKLDLEVSLRDPSDVGNVDTVGSFDENDQGIIIFEHKQEENYVETKKFNYEEVNDLTIELMPGDYSVKAFVIQEDETNKIESKEDCHGGGAFSSEECVTLPQMNLTSWLRASYEYEGFSVSTQELLDKDTLELKLLDVGVPETYDELEEASQNLKNIEETSEDFPPRLKDVE